jgi:hypothetical protein
MACSFSHVVQQAPPIRDINKHLINYAPIRDINKHLINYGKLWVYMCIILVYWQASNTLVVPICLEFGQPSIINEPHF